MLLPQCPSRHTENMIHFFEYICRDLGATEAAAVDLLLIGRHSKVLAILLRSPFGTQFRFKQDATCTVILFFITFLLISTDLGTANVGMSARECKSS